MGLEYEAEAKLPFGAPKGKVRQWIASRCMVKQLGICFSESAGDSCRLRHVRANINLCLLSRSAVVPGQLV